MRITTSQAPPVNFSIDHDREHDQRQDRAERVDRRAPPPARLAGRGRQWRTMPALAEREAHEHADRVQRDQQRGVAAEGDEQRRRDRGQEDDPPAVREPVAAERELARHVAVLGEDRGQPRERVEARVRGEEQDQRRARPGTGRTAGCRPPNAAVATSATTVGPPDPPPTGRCRRRRATNVMPMNRTPSSTAIAIIVLAAFFASGGLNAGTPLAIASTPVSATEPLANARRSSRIPSRLGPERHGLGLGRQRRRPSRPRSADSARSPTISSASPTNR